MNYRVADQKDLPALEELGLASYGRLKKHLTPENWAKMETLLKSDQTFPILVRDCHSFLCEENGRILGMAYLVPSGNPTKVYSAEIMYAARHIYEIAGFKKVRLLDEHYGLPYWLYQLDIK